MIAGRSGARRQASSNSAIKVGAVTTLQGGPASECDIFSPIMQDEVRFDMAGYMRTTIHIPDLLFEEAQRIASLEQRTLQAMILEGLCRVIAEHKKSNRLRKAAFTGKGLQPNFTDASWERIRDAAYEGRGG
jgi:hypothetical protein